MDHTDFEIRKIDKKAKKKARSSDEPDFAYWWTKAGDEIARAMFDQAKAIVSRQRNLKAEYEFYSKFLGDRDNLSDSTGAVDTSNEHTSDVLSDNVTLEVVETRESNITVHRTRPAFATSAGNWKQQMKARELNRFCAGAFYDNRIDEVVRLVRRDDEKCGWGSYKVFEEDGRVRGERVLPYENIVCELEAKYGKPRQRFHAKTIPMHRLLSDYANKEFAKLVGRSVEELREIILKAGLDDTITPGDKSINDLRMVTTLEGWHLESCEGAGDGLWALCLTSGTLFARPYTRKTFPFADYITEPPHVGYRGRGMVEKLAPDQIRINILNLSEDEMVELGVPKWVVQRGTRIDDEELDNTILGALQYDGPVAPKIEQGAQVPESLLRRKEEIRAGMYRKGRVSEMAVNNEKPAGLDSEPAQRAFQDITEKRMAKDFRAHEQWHIDVARLFVDGARDIAKRLKEEAENAPPPKEGEKPKAKPSYRVKVPGPNGYQEIDWADIDLEEDSYVIQPTPISALPNDWSGRVQTISERISMGWMTPEEGMLRMEMPDSESSTNLNAAALHNALWKVNRILEKGRYSQPEPYSNYDVHHRIALAIYNWAETAGYPDRKLRSLGQYIDAVVAKKLEVTSQVKANPMAPAMPPEPGQPPQGLPPGGPPGGAPALPPAPPPPSPMPAEV